MGSNNRETTFYKEVLPFAAMVTMECINVGLNTLYKAATNKGMSNHVFVVYSYGLAALLLLPSPFFSTRYMLCFFFLYCMFVKFDQESDGVLKN